MRTKLTFEKVLKSWLKLAIVTATIGGTISLFIELVMVGG